MEADDLLCSRNARPQKALVGRAQWKINQPPSLKRERASLEESLAVRHVRVWNQSRRSGEVRSDPQAASRGDTNALSKGE
jgi:hypothetical protein